MAGVELLQAFEEVVRRRNQMLTAGTMAVESQLQDGVPMDENAGWQWAQGFFVQADWNLDRLALENQNR